MQVPEIAAEAGLFRQNNWKQDLLRHGMKAVIRPKPLVPARRPPHLRERIDLRLLFKNDLPWEPGQTIPRAIGMCLSRKR